ncbi:MAG TPA: 3'-5' exonuclease [Marinilabiliales bacterium]|jgi:ribonuclease D|nr:MAG: 3'-5' exonuclease [Bacteroidetes bacterium GWA2_40_14]OFX58718.1 MAG: 3'-5' exonuclease [Bacteroidetes bacterium GWC2_40_13]OFX71855.1 MAG: 3'-5' exonuclease [Bacteroidetes bacterium GWD2_40_43]OFX94653.1 MAG: 3'-5' exonuclease [Bacteroidetes bacterium GWE2_40_63]OFY17954.1 MAG: 3'-5' exonuclease [Bacteroidetes bacterium GWF2_40_13]OFZ24418.1 MAG: 3'-5' exonuclease [Bacteroidetes bacterium RIFOXYC2_FULL_40_12]HAM98419.1 3'-5' exonuclease [Marinilabiliales bacterium]
MNKCISKEELNELPVQGFDGEIIVMDFARDVKKIAPFLKKQKVLGFDTETKPNFAKGKKNQVALLQLATEKSAFIFRINKMGLPPELMEVLSDPKIVKVGVAIKDDIKALKNIHSFEPSGFVEIQEKVKDFQIESFSLKKLSGLLLGFRISKAQQTSNWEADQLTEAQIKYAATDAWVSLGIYNRLLEIEKAS